MTGAEVRLAHSSWAIWPGSHTHNKLTRAVRERVRRGREPARDVARDVLVGLLGKGLGAAAARAYN